MAHISFYIGCKGCTFLRPYVSLKASLSLQAKSEYLCVKNEVNGYMRKDFPNTLLSEKCTLQKMHPTFLLLQDKLRLLLQRSCSPKSKQTEVRSDEERTRVFDCLWVKVGKPTTGFYDGADAISASFQKPNSLKKSLSSNHANS